MLKIELEKENESLKEELARAIETNEVIVKTATDSDRKIIVLTEKVTSIRKEYELEKKSSELFRNAVNSCADKADNLTDKAFQLQESKTLYETDHANFPPVERIRERVEPQEVDWRVFYNQLAGAVTVARDICLKPVSE